ncbi:hypothetical protein EC991_007154 [Linnemannia zychae]|nr:hypothetical protein EC991_007154 [Linnemannia zychae]
MAGCSPGALVKPKEKNVKAQMQKYLSTLDKAEKMAKDLETRLKIKDLATLLAPSKPSESRKRRNSDDSHITEEGGNKKKHKNKNRNNNNKPPSFNPTNPTNITPQGNTSTTTTGAQNTQSFFDSGDPTTAQNTLNHIFNSNSTSSPRDDHMDVTQNQ